MRTVARKRFCNGIASLLFVGALGVSAFYTQPANAATLFTESFTGVSTPVNAWLSGGDISSEKACLTAATTSAVGSIPACTGGPFDAAGSGYLRLTNNTTFQSGFAIYDTPISSSAGLDVAFDMLQYGGTGADGISFFLIDGSANPTVPGSYGGSLGYSSDTVSSGAGIVGGYVGVGFDVFGNFSDPNYGTGGPGMAPNSIVIRGSEASGYQYISGVAASGSLSGTTRVDSVRNVRVIITTDGLMSVFVDYGSGYVSELTDVDLAAVNGSTMPATFKFGFAASTGAQTNNHEIQMLEVQSVQPDLSMSISHTENGDITKGALKPFYINVTNDADAADTTDPTTVTLTFPDAILPKYLINTGDGWSCTFTGQTVSCTNNNNLAAGSSFPPIQIMTEIVSDATSPVIITGNVSVNGNANPNPTASHNVVIVAASASTPGAPNTGIGQTSQSTPIVASFLGVGLLGLAVRRIRQQ